MPSAADDFIREVWGLQGAAYLVVGLRYYARIQQVGIKGLAWDDFLMFLATAAYTCETVLAYTVVAYWAGLANNGMTDEQRRTLDPNSYEYYQRQSGAKTHVCGLISYIVQLWLLKGCWVVYYSRLTAGVAKMRKWILTSAVIVVLTFIGCLLVAFLKCIPFNKQWQIYPSPGNHCFPAISTIQTVFVLVMNSATDFLLMAIPLPVVYQTHLPWRKKFGLMLLFSGAILEMTFGILRAWSVLVLGDINAAQSGYWSVRESFVSMVVTNLPMVYPLLRGWFMQGHSLVTSSKGGPNAEDTTRANTHGYRLGSYPRSGKDSKVVPNETTWDSKEQIVLEDVNPVSSQDGVGNGGQNGSGNDDASSFELPKHSQQMPSSQIQSPQNTGGMKSSGGGVFDGSRNTSRGSEDALGGGQDHRWLKNAARGGSDDAAAAAAGGMGGRFPSNKIVVTTEYTVKEGADGSSIGSPARGPARDKTKGSSGGGYRY